MKKHKTIKLTELELGTIWWELSNIYLDDVSAKKYYAIQRVLNKLRPKN